MSYKSKKESSFSPRRECYSSSFHQNNPKPSKNIVEDNQYSHLFYKRKLEMLNSNINKPPLHTKSLNEDIDNEKKEKQEKNNKYEKNIKNIEKHQNFDEYENSYKNDKNRKNDKEELFFEEYSFDKKHKRIGSYDLNDEKKNQYDFLKKKTQMILEDLNKMKGKSARYNEKSPKNTYKFQKMSEIIEKTHKNDKNQDFLEKTQKNKKNREIIESFEKNPKNDEIQEKTQKISKNCHIYKDLLQKYKPRAQTAIDEKYENSRNFTKIASDSSESEILEPDAKENLSNYSNLTKNMEKQRKITSFDEKSRKNEDWMSGGNKNKRDIEMLSNIHEKDLEIIELKNNITKFEMEAKTTLKTLKKMTAMIEKYKIEVGKLIQDKGLKEKEIEYLKVFYSNLKKRKK